MKRKVLVTGASKGLGKVVCESLPEYEVIPFTRKDFDYLHPRDEAIDIPEVDIIIHCAGGGLGLRQPLITAQQFHDLFMVNLGGGAELNRLVASFQGDSDFMKGFGSVRIISASGSAARNAPATRFAIACTSRAE